MPAEIPGGAPKLVTRLRFWARSIVFNAYGGNTESLPRLAAALLVDNAFWRLDKLRAGKKSRA
jgi:hypothetical protein